MTKDTFNKKWVTIKPMIRKHWAKITEDDMAHINGRIEDLIYVLRKRYGYGQAQAEIQLKDWLNELDRNGDR